MSHLLLSSVLSPLLALSLPAQAPGEPLARSPQLPPVAANDVTRGAGLQPDGADRLFGGGTDYAVWLSAEGVRFVPALGRGAEVARHVALRPLEVRRGQHVVARDFDAVPQRTGLRAEYHHTSSATERYDVGADAVELSWRFERRPAGSGDLVVRYRLDTNLPLAEGGDEDALRFVQPDLGGVTIGTVTGIDARGGRAAGGMAYTNGVLELSLPASFVDTATYPIVLDPTIGPAFTVSSSFDDFEADVAYDATSQRYLVVWLRTLAANLVLPRGRLLEATGAPLGGTILLGSTGVCGRPRVANHDQGDRFGVVFAEQAGLFHGIQLRVVGASTGAISHSTVIASSTGVDLFRDPDVGGDVAGVGGTAFVVVYEDEILNAIRARRVLFDPLDNLLAPSAASVWTDGTGPIASVYSQPAVSRQAGSDGTLLVVARRLSGIGPSYSVQLKRIAIDDLGDLGAASLGSTTDSLDAPDVDGMNGSWVVAWQRDPAGSATTIERRAVRHDGNWQLGPVETLGGGVLQAVTAPSLGWSAARTWLGYHNFSGIGPQRSLRVAAIDTATATMGGVELTQTIASDDTRIAVASDASGGVVGGNDAMAVFAHGARVYAQRLIGYGSGGTFTSLGGQCGSGGAQFVSHAPGIGSSIVFGVVGLDPTALVTVFNLTPDLAPIACGTCEWAPFAITDLRVVTGGSASVPFVMPMLPSLIGSQWVTQWTTYDPAQVPCPLLPEFVLTDRSLMTLGN